MLKADLKREHDNLLGDCAELKQADHERRKNFTRVLGYYRDKDKDDDGPRYLGMVRRRSERVLEWDEILFEVGRFTAEADVNKLDKLTEALSQLEVKVGEFIRDHEKKEMIKNQGQL